MTSGADNPSHKVEPDTLALRSKPRPIARIKRHVLLAASTVGLVLIFGAAMLALDPPGIVDEASPGRELYRTDHNPRPEGLEALPHRYSDMAPIQLGPPLPGDLGNAILSAERDLGLEVDSDLPFRPNAEDDALRGERIRQARLAQQGRESGLFFQLASSNGNVSPDPEEQEGLSGHITRAGQRGDLAERMHSETGSHYDTQDRKVDFLEQAPDRNIYNSHMLQDPVSPYQLMAGSIIAASLVTGIKSDLPGSVIAQVTENIYDTVTGQYLLIPQGTRLIGTYDSVIAFGQERALVVWQRLVMPDGSSIMVESFPASDRAGYAGLEDQVDFHSWRLLKGITLSSLLGVSTELTLGNDESDLVAALRDAAQGSTNQAGERITERYLNVQPTVTIRPGWPVRIIVHKDMVLRPYND